MQLLSLSIDTLDRAGQQGICPLAPVPHWVRALPGEMNDLWDADISQYDIKCLTFREDSCETPHTYSEVSKDEATIHHWYSSVVGLAFLFTSTVSSFLLTSPSVYKTCQNVSMTISVYACFISEPHCPCWLVCFGVCCIYVILQKNVK